MGVFAVSAAATAAVGIILSALVAGAVIFMIRSRKRGKSCCCADCRGCPSSGDCPEYRTGGKPE